MSPYRAKNSSGFQPDKHQFIEMRGGFFENVIDVSIAYKIFGTHAHHAQLMENRVDKCGVFGRLRGGSSGMSGLACLFQNIMNNNTISRFFIMKKLMKVIASSCVMALGLCVFAAEASATLGETSLYNAF